MLGGRAANAVEAAQQEDAPAAFGGQRRQAPDEVDAWNAVAQRARLETLQARLPEKVAKKRDLTRLAGKLTGDQLDAVEYFVNQRYPASK